MPDDARVIGRVAAGTVIAREMISAILQEHWRGEPPHLWMDQVKSPVQTTEAPAPVVIFHAPEVERARTGTS